MGVGYPGGSGFRLSFVAGSQRQPLVAAATVKPDVPVRGIFLPEDFHFMS